MVGLVFQIVVEKTMLCKFHNKGTCRYAKQAEHTDKGITYQHFCINCFANAGRKYDHPKLACKRLKNDKKRSNYAKGLTVVLKPGLMEKWWLILITQFHMILLK